MFDALTPLRRAYGVDAPGEPPVRVHPAPGEAAGAGPPGAGGPVAVETNLLCQSRAAVEAAVASQDRRPSAAVLNAVLAEAARASAEALAPLVAVRALYGEPTPALVPAASVEAALLAQSRTALDRAAAA
ncbi:MAG TPA: hypothetical protein VF576_12685, partial [Rubricoccaceae bacterium]